MPPYCAREEAVCGGCAHFRLHYIKIGSCYRPIAYWRHRALLYRVLRNFSMRSRPSLRSASE